MSVLLLPVLFCWCNHLDARLLLLLEPVIPILLPVCLCGCVGCVVLLDGGDPHSGESDSDMLSWGAFAGAFTASLRHAAVSLLLAEKNALAWFPEHATGCGVALILLLRTTGLDMSALVGLWFAPFYSDSRGFALGGRLVLGGVGWSVWGQGLS